MKFTLKQALDVVAQVLLALIIFTLFILWMKPLIETTHNEAKNHIRTGAMFCELKAEDTIAKIEKRSYRNSWVAFYGLNNVYRQDALKKSGVDLEVPNASFDSVDLSKPNDLFPRAIEQLSDVQLLYLLKNTDYLYDDAAAKEKILASQECFKKTVNGQNRLQFLVHNSFDQATKDNLKACKVKLEDKLSNTFYEMMNQHSFGTCTDSPPASFGSILWDDLTNWK
ncbi:hypothetical protein V0M98_34260 (plasmid) [Pseudomonas silesiensis]|uniref:hypothetical protein n=1 Tax=Pseudomonas silesiensis TaxID=1853130 RepID=UPI0030D4BD7B